jgi:hypothetical protein
MNVQAIQLKAEAGDLKGAHDALDSLLEMGPNNLEALKLRARLHEVAGRFHEEAQIWEKVARIDREDEELFDYLLRRQNEDRENFYFTDSLPSGGKRFLAYPRRMIRSAVFGLIGCLGFLTLARLGIRFPILNHPVAMLGSFGLMVIAPWVAIMWSYGRSIRYITIGMEGLEVATRFKIHKIPRNQIHKVVLTLDDLKSQWQLNLVVTTVDQSIPNVSIDFNEKTTSIRARSYFLRELTRFCGEAEYSSMPEISSFLKDRKLIKA